MGLFSRSRIETVALIDVGARSIEAGLALYVTDQIPYLAYSTAVPIETPTQEGDHEAMLRALGEALRRLHEQGVPALIRLTGSATISSALVSLDAPWQETGVYTHMIAREKPFVVTQKMVQDAIDTLTPPERGVHYTDVSVVGTIVNGYEVRSPYGKRVQQVSVIVLTSHMEESLHSRLIEAVQTLGRGLEVSILAGASLRYQALRILFPHEKDVLLVDATRPLPEIALVRKGVLIAVSETSQSVSSDNEAGPGDLMNGLTTIAKSYPLPHTILLLARTERLRSSVGILNALHYDAFGRVDSPPRIIPLVAGTMKSVVRVATTESPDLPLLLMALYYQYLEQRP